MFVPFVVAALAFGGLPAGASGQGDPIAPDLEAALGEVARRIPRLMARDGVPGLVVLVIRGGDPAASAAFGLADPAAGRPMGVDALFRVESISKPVTAWGVLRLEQEGTIGLDDPVQDHLARWVPPPGTPPLTVVQLLSHTAGVGLGDYTARYPPTGPTPSLSTSLDREYRQVAPPGGGFRYSDTGFNLLQAMVEDVTGRPFDEFMESEVLTPLGMTGATFGWRAEAAEHMPVGHSLQGEPVEPYVYAGLGSGGLLATVHDVGRFAVASMAPPWGSGRPVLGDQAVSKLHEERVAVGGLYGVVTDGYGLGHFTERLSDGRRAVWHGGQGYGWMSHLHVVPSSGDGIVLLANSQRAWPLFAAVLGGWSRTLGVDPVKMSRIGRARPLALAGVGLMVLAAGWLGRGWLRRPPDRRLRPLPGALRALAGIGLLSAVGWAATRDYLFLFSILPSETRWLGGAATLLGLALLLSVLPRPGRRWASVTALLTLPALPLPTAGQETGPVEAARAEIVRYLASPVSRARSGPFDEAAVTAVRGWAALPFVHRTPTTFLGGRVSGSYTSIDPRPLDPVQPLWVEALYDVELQLVGSRRLDAKWWLTLVAAPGIASDFRNVDLDHLTLGGTVLAQRTGGAFDWGVGLAASNDFGETRVVPLGSLDWTRESLAVHLLLPAQATVEWAAGSGLVLGFDARVDGNVYTLGREGLLADGLVRYSVWELGPRLDYALGSRLRVGVRGGLAAGRRLEAEDAAGTRTEDAGLDAGVVVALTLSLRLPGSGS